MKQSGSRFLCGSIHDLGWRIKWLNNYFLDLGAFQHGNPKFSYNGIRACLVCFSFYFVCFYKEHKVDKNVSMVP